MNHLRNSQADLLENLQAVNETFKYNRWRCLQGAWRYAVAAQAKKGGAVVQLPDRLDFNSLDIKVYKDC